MLESLFNKVVGLKDSNTNVNIAIFLRTVFYRTSLVTASDDETFLKKMSTSLAEKPQQRYLTGS